MSPNHVQRKHRYEREAVIDDALRHSLEHLQRADNHFGSAIGDKELRSRFSTRIHEACEVLVELGVEDAFNGA